MRRLKPITVVTCFVVSSGLVLGPSSTMARGAGGPEAAERAMVEVNAVADAQGALGVYWDPKKDQAVIVLPRGRSADDSSLADLEVPARFQSAEVSAIEVAEIVEELTSLADNADMSGSYGFSFEAESGRVLIEGSAPKALFADVLDKWAGKVAFRANEGGRLSRESDFAPFWGGAQVRDAGSVGFDCTTGIPVYSSSGTEFMVTAGHCPFSLGETLYPGHHPSLPSMGYLANKASFPNKDMALIGGKDRAGYVYMGAYGQPETTSRIVSAGDPAQGFSGYCWSGATTLEHCGMTAQSTDATFCDAEGCTPHLVRYSGGLAADKGDSGAPILLKRDSTTVLIRGILVGRQGDDLYAHKWGTISNTWGLTVLTN